MLNAARKEVSHSNGNVFFVKKDFGKRSWVNSVVDFGKFDVIVTSDTAPLSRIFLQNNWKKPLIIWICNRFDYVDYGVKSLLIVFNSN